MYTLGLIRRVAIAACGAFALLVAVACQNGLAQSRLPIRNIQVDVAPLRVRRRPDTLVGAAGATDSTCQSSGWPHVAERGHTGRADRLSHSGAK